MATTFTINGTSYSFPTQGQDPPYGDDIVAAITALVAVANSVNGTGDILTTSFTIANNTSSSANVTGANWDPSVVRSAILSYSIYRSSTTTENSEAGLVLVTYSSTAGTWELAQNFVGTSGVTFTITNGGQLKYTSSNFSGTSYVGKLKFKSISTFLQA